MGYETLDLKPIGNRIRELRKSLGLFQDNFAKSLNVSNATLSEVENGKTKAGFDILFNLSASFNVNLDYILLGTGKPFKEKENPSIESENQNTNSSEILSFGELTDDVKDMLELMKNSRLFLLYMLAKGRGYALKNASIIKLDIWVTKNGLSLSEDLEKICQYSEECNNKQI